jgi:subtilisin family serine protease
MFRRSILLALFVFLATPAWSQSLWICQMKYGNGADPKEVAARMGGTVVDSMSGGIYLMEMSSLPTGPIPEEVRYLEVDKGTAIAPFRRAVMSIGSRTPEDWYRNQPAMKQIHLARAQARSRGRRVVIATIDSGVDYSHPALRSVLTSGYDFVAGRPYRFAAPAAGSLDESTTSFLDQSSTSFLDEWSAAFLDESSASFLDQSSATFLDATNPAHGHGTMVAGIIAGMAPESMIMPLRVFDDQGQADVFTIAKAIDYAVRNGASVINMSFGLHEPSPTLEEAIEWALEAGVVLIASAGNNDTAAPQYPAAYPGVIAVAATDLSDRKAPFSNYGPQVAVSAPGVNIISSYFAEYYSIASGTSFSAPIVAGEAALILSMGLDPREIIPATVRGIDTLNPQYSLQLGTGRIDFSRMPREEESHRPRSMILYER